MSWFRVDADLPGHPKLLRLAALAGMEPDLTVGKLNRLWGWAQKYAEDGDLSRFDPTEINLALGLPSHSEILKHLIACGFVDSFPYARIHDWWEYVGPWLIAKYKKSPAKWKRVRRIYNTPIPKQPKVTVTGTVTEQLRNSDVTAHRRTGQDVQEVKSEAKSRSSVVKHQTARESHDTASLTRGSKQPDEENGEGATAQISTGPPEPLAEFMSWVWVHVPGWAQGKARKGWGEPDDRLALAGMIQQKAIFELQACWMLFIRPGSREYDFASGQKFSMREFKRQLDHLVDDPDYPQIKRRYMDGDRKFQTAGSSP